MRISSAILFLSDSSKFSIDKLVVSSACSLSSFFFDSPDYLCSFNLAIISPMSASFSSFSANSISFLLFSSYSSFRSFSFKAASSFIYLSSSLASLSAYSFF
jgi:hypothetical protein